MSYTNKTREDFEILSAKYDYDPETGVFTFRTGHKKDIGRVAGANTNGYLSLGYKNQ